MTRAKQVNTENGAVLNRDFPSRSRSLIMVPQGMKTPAHIDIYLCICYTIYR